MLSRRLLLGALAAPAVFRQASAATPAGRWIADLWYAHNALSVMLGAAGQVAVTVAAPERFPWMYKMAPALAGAAVVGPGPANVETLLAAGVKLSFVSAAAQATRLQAQGMRALAVGFVDQAGLLNSLHRSAIALGTPLAQRRAAAYEALLAEVTASLQHGLQGLQEAQRPRVLHLASLNPLRADGAGTIIDDWLTLAGARNAATGLHGPLQVVSLEQVAVWNPERIIISGTAPGQIAQQPLWQALPAVQAGAVLRNPAGVFPWDRYGPEYALQLLWAARMLHPQRFPHLDLAHRTQDFYRRFFDYSLSVAEAQEILTPA